MTTQVGTHGPGLAFDASRLRPHRRRRFNWRRPVIAVALVYAAFLAAHQVVAYERLQRQLGDIQKQVATLDADNARLRAESASLGSSAYVEQEARGQLGLVRSGEVPFQPVQR